MKELEDKTSGDFIHFCAHKTENSEKKLVSSLKCDDCVCVRVRGDDGVLMVCERCDKSYHAHCLTPPPDYTQSPGWRCKVRQTHT